MAVDLKVVQMAHSLRNCVYSSFCSCWAGHQAAWPLSALDNGCMTVTYWVCFSDSPEGQNNEYCLERFPELFGYSSSTQNTEMGRVANIYSPFSQGTFTVLITRRFFMITTITIKKGIHLRNQPLGSVNKNTSTSRSIAYLCQILSYRQAHNQRNPDFKPVQGL